MRGLFWKFFTIIWLTMAASIAGPFILINLLDAVPFSQDIVREQRAFTLDVAARLLEQQGKDAAEAFARAAAAVPRPVNLTVSEIGPSSACPDVEADPQAPFPGRGAPAAGPSRPRNRHRREHR